ncbi:MAG: DUF1553 domain-containing protein, partial [Verrucomicrobiota bacterium]
FVIKPANGSGGDGIIVIDGKRGDRYRRINGDLIPESTLLHHAIRDYYAMYSAFAATQLSERPVPFLTDENLVGMDEDKELVQTLLTYAEDTKKAIEGKQERAAKKWYEENGLPYKTLNDRKKDDDDIKPPRHVGLSPEETGKLKVRTQDEWVWKRRLERFEPMVQSVYNGPDPKSEFSRKLRMNAKANVDWRPESRILDGGSLEAPGEKVDAGVLSALKVPVDESKANQYAVGDQLHGRRLSVAKWITDQRNPLTARVIVNRVWQYHFGKPLAGNPNNFGVKGEKPTHPELLDWLAADFVDNGWRMKRLHKLILTSRVYQQEGHHSARGELDNVDPNNKLLAYFPNRRLSAEELRDGMLSITGELNTDMGGLPIRPEMNMEVALQPRMIQFSLAPAYQPSQSPEQRNRRSIYAYRVRGLANPFLETFNQPNPNDSCEMRDSAAVSPQAFTMMNSDYMTARSIAMAVRLESEGSDLEHQVARAIDLCFGREATAEETQVLKDYVIDMRGYHVDVQPETQEYPTKLTRQLVEEFTGEPFQYEEILPAFENYQPDTQPADVSAETRALADLCLLLFNSNEFMYIY